MLVRYAAVLMLLLRIQNGLRAAASAFPPLARRVGQSRLRANCGGPIPAHVSDVVYRPTAGFLTTLFRFEPPFRRDGWPKDFAERETEESGAVPSLKQAVASRVQPPLEVSRSYYHARLEQGIVCWIHIDEPSNRGMLFELG